MTKTVRDRIINALITIITGGCIVLFGNWRSNKHEDREKLDKRLTEVEKKKLDIADYTEDQKKRWDAHDKINEVQEKRSEETHRMVRFLYENEIKKHR